jgi:hypothetical protein
MAQSPRPTLPRTHFPHTTSASLAQPQLHRSSSSSAQTHTPSIARARSPLTPPTAGLLPPATASSAGASASASSNSSTAIGSGSGQVRALQIGWRESADNTVYVREFEPSTVRALVHYCYTSQLSIHSIRSWQQAIDLYRAADMYGLPSVCEAAVQIIARHLSGASSPLLSPLRTHSKESE